MKKALAVALFLVGALLPQAGVAHAALPDEDTTEAIGLNCTTRIAIPNFENVREAKWSPDGSTLAVIRSVRIPAPNSVSGFREEEVLETLDVKSGKVRNYGEGFRVSWSGSGRYLAYWGPEADYLLVLDKGEVVAQLLPSVPEYRWAGDSLYYIQRSTIRVWKDGEAQTLVKMVDRVVPHYPVDDVHWSGDGSLFTLNRYKPDVAEPEVYIGTTETGDVRLLEIPGATYTEWAPTGTTLLVRYPTRLVLRDETAQTQTTIPIARNALHQWSADGKALMLRTSRATLAAGDAVEDARIVWPASRAAVAKLPNLVGMRSFSANGKYFSGTVRTDRYDLRLVAFKCTDLPLPMAADPELQARLAKINSADKRFIQPAIGGLAQFLERGHTGIDVSAPMGSPITSVDDGVVQAVGFIPNGGYRVCVAHAGGLETCYFHTSGSLVGVGERVVRGQPIALVGMSGLVLGPHLHYEAKLFGRLVDPLAR